MKNISGLENLMNGFSAFAWIENLTLTASWEIQILYIHEFSLQIITCNIYASM
jgi:hypothetical protein